MFNANVFLNFPIIFLTLISTYIVDCQKPNMDYNRRHDVYIAGFFPYGRGVENSNTGRGVMPSVKLALDHVNDHTGYLRNYRLHMWWNDTECNAAVGVKAFFDMMHSGPHKLMLFGAACTHVTDPIAKASKHWHLTQLSYADTHPMFTSDNFPNFFRIVPSENAFNAPRLALMRKFNWTRVGTIYQNEPRYSLAHNRLVADLDTMNAEVVETQSFAKEVRTALMKLKEKDVRIILGNFAESWARKVFCEAYRLGLYGKKYQWIIMGTYNEEWWNIPVRYSNCSNPEIVDALEQTMLTDLLPLATTGEITVAGITPDEYKVEYDSRRGLEYSRFHGYTYDGIWAIALAIQHVAHTLKFHRRPQTVTDFQYRDPEWERLFLDALGNTSFEGVTGPVRFYGNERKASIMIKQFQQGSEVKVGEYNAATEMLDLELGAPLKWLGKHPPKDRTLEIIERAQVNKTLYLIFAATAIIGIIMASIFLAINIKYRNQRYIKMSSPQLNNLIIIGCMLAYTSVVFLGLDSGLSSVAAFPHICTARAWTLMAGFSLAFGAMFSKTWRVHSIFTDVKLNKKVIKDCQLFMVVGVLLAIDFVIMITWQVADPFYRETKKMEPYPHPSNDDIIIIHENEYCQSERMTIFIVSIYIYKGLLMILGAFLAWETRHVSIPALNDSRHVGLSVYNVVIICICGAAVALVLSDRRDAAFAIISIFIIFCTTTTLCLVFVPKVVELKRNPGGSIDKRIRATLRPMGNAHRESSSELEHRIREVKQHNAKYRKTLMDRENELQMLIKTLGVDAKDIIDGQAKDKLTVPLLKREPISLTDPSDTTSLCSLSSTQDTLGSKKKLISSHSSESNKHTEQPLQPILKHADKRSESERALDKSISQQSTLKLSQLGHGNEPERRDTTTTPTKQVEFLDQQTGGDICIQNIIPTSTLQSQNHDVPSRKSSASSMKTKTVEPHHHHHHDEKSKFITDDQWQTEQSDGVFHRRVSVPGAHTPKKPAAEPQFVSVCAKDKSSDFTQAYFVSKSDLWNTQASSGSVSSLSSVGQHRCTAHKRVNISSQPDVNHTHECDSSATSPIHRSVSEKSRHRSSSRDYRATTPTHERKSHGSTCSTPQHQPKPYPTETKKMPTISNQHCSKYGYVKSTPNVSSTTTTTEKRTATTEGNGMNGKHDPIYTTSSESELLDGGAAILPIFQKLLTERKRSQQKMNFNYGQSCPNISIKCDIVEYL